MKTHVFKRLSAFVAGTAVALTGALAAMPAAHAASTVEIPVTYTLIAVNSNEYPDFSATLEQQTFTSRVNPSGATSRVGLSMAGVTASAAHGSNKIVFETSLLFPGYSADRVSGAYEWEISFDEWQIENGYYAFFPETTSLFRIAADWSGSGQWENVKVYRVNDDLTTWTEVSEINTSLIRRDYARSLSVVNNVENPDGLDEKDSYTVHVSLGFGADWKAAEGSHYYASDWRRGVLKVVASLRAAVEMPEMCDSGTAKFAGVSLPDYGTMYSEDALSQFFREWLGKDRVGNDQEWEKEIPSDIFDQKFECDITLGKDETRYLGGPRTDINDPGYLAAVMDIASAGASVSVEPVVPDGAGYVASVDWDGQIKEGQHNSIKITNRYGVAGVSFDANAADATGSTAGLTGQPYGSTVTLPVNGFERDGYTFKGWNTQADGKGVGYADKDSFTVPATDTVLYAQWEKVSAPSTPTATPTASPSATPSGDPTTPVKPTPTDKPTIPSPSGKPTTPAPTGSPSVQPTIPAPGDTCAADDPAKQEKVYRLYNPGNSEHLFTTDAVEYEVLADKHGWKQEGVAWVGPNSKGSSVGVYRLYNAGLGDHHYTKDQKEAQKLVSEFGWVYDNNGEPLFYSEDNDKCARINVYRQYNGGLKTGQHHYTADKTEWDTLAAKHGWQKEGIGWYALSWPNPKG